jgi:putative chitinase
MNDTAFFNAIRKSLFGGAMTQGQVDGVSVILDVFAGADPRWTAYALATAFLETDRTMQPIKEYGGEAYFKRRYDINGSNPNKARELGNVKPGDGAKYAGRGFVQLTGRDNYARAEKALNVPLINQPDLAMKPETAALIMYRGMVEGWFTGKKLAQYFDHDTTDWTNARRIINGLDKAQLIASYARTYHAALISAQGKGDAPAKPPKPPVVTKEMQSDPVEPDAPVAPHEAPKADDAPIWEKSPVLRQIVNTASALGITGASFLGLDWRVVIALAVIIAGVSIYAIHFQAKRA